jgi:hypothetical protein
VGCTEGSPEEAELSPLAEVIDAYEAKRWPSRREHQRELLVAGMLVSPKTGL